MPDVLGCPGPPSPLLCYTIMSLSRYVWSHAMHQCRCPRFYCLIHCTTQVFRMPSSPPHTRFNRFQDAPDWSDMPTASCMGIQDTLILLPTGTSPAPDSSRHLSVIPCITQVSRMPSCLHMLLKTNVHIVFPALHHMNIQDILIDI